MASIINAVSGSGITQTADGSGVLKIQSNSVTTNALAWVNFNGTGTVAIRSSYNVSSITDNGTGDYTINFATALSDANYAAISSCGNGDAATRYYASSFWTSAPTTSAFRVRVTDGSVAQDAAYNAISIFGN